MEIEARKIEIRTQLEGEVEVNLEEVKKEIEELDKEVKEIEAVEEKRSIASKILVGKIEARKIEKEEPKMEPNVIEKKSESFNKFLRDGDVTECRALQMDSPTQAGYLVAPEKFVNEVIQTLNNDLFFRNIAKVLPMLNGAQSLGYPKRTTAMARAVWGTEIAAPTADTALAFGKREFKPKPMTAEIVVSKTLIKNAPNVDSIVRNEFAFAFGETAEISYMTGDGVNKPLGVFTASVDGISTARDVSTGNTATEIKFDGLMNALGSIKNQYRKNLKWVFHRDAETQLRKLKDANGQYIWQQSLMASTPNMLLGFPVFTSEYAPNTFTTGQYVGILGDFSNYWICDSMNFEMQALMELLARTNQVDYIGRMETDGAPVIEEAFARVKLA